MKKLLLLIALMGCLSVYAQSESKNEVYDKIKNSYAWINFQMLETYTTLNLTEEQ